MNSDISNLVVGAVFFIIGNVSGYFFHDILKKTMDMEEDRSKNFILVIVTTIWAISMVVDLLNPSYEAPLALHGLMGAIVGFFFYRPKSQ